MYFEQLHQRLIANLRRRIQNGELTERNLAMLSGISQPHIHNVLKGVRKFSPEIADIVMHRAQLQILDLFERKELTEFLSKGVPTELRYCQVPFLDGTLGPGLPTPKLSNKSTECYSIPHSQMNMLTDPVAARLAFDPEMRSVFSGNEVVLRERPRTLGDLLDEVFAGLPPLTEQDHADMDAMLAIIKEPQVQQERDWDALFGNPLAKPTTSRRKRKPAP